MEFSVQEKTVWTIWNYRTSILERPILETWNFDWIIKFRTMYPDCTTCFSSKFLSFYFILEDFNLKTCEFEWINKFWIMKRTVQNGVLIAGENSLKNIKLLDLHFGTFNFWKIAIWNLRLWLNHQIFNYETDCTKYFLSELMWSQQNLYKML